MLRAKPVIAAILLGLMTLPAFAQTQSITLPNRPGFFNGFVNPYRPHAVPEISFADSPRIEKLVRAGNIYLSLRDAIALALENNLDIETARLQPKLSISNLQRAYAGQLLRNVSTSIASGPSSASLGVLAGANALGTTGGGGGGSSNQGVLSGLNVQLAGSAIPNLDPTLFVQGQFNHQTQILTSTVVTGTTSLVTQYKTLVYGIQQGYWTGTQVALYTSSVLGYNQNAPNNLFNPYDSASLGLQISQNLLNGFGLAVNKRALNQAKNNLKVSDLTFKQQVIATVSNVVNLYWDLVSFNDELKVKKQTMELDSKLYEDNKRRADLGAIAPIDIIQAEAEMKAAQQDVVTQESQVLQQEMILKSVLTRSGLDNSVIAMAHIVPTDHIEVPTQEAVIPVQDLVAEALRNRPEIEQNQISLENARLSMLGTKNNLLPTLTATASFSNAGQAGQVNSIPQAIRDPVSGQILGYRQLTPADVNGFFLGGYGSALKQVFSRNFPNYSVGFTLNIPIRNRANQADLITDEINYRQSQIQDRQLRNNIKLNVLNAYTALREARAAYDTAVEARRLQDQTLAGNRRKYELGTATILDVVIAQRDATTRQLQEVDTRDQLQRARTNLQQVLGRVLETFSVSLDEAKAGQVGREPDMIPAVLDKQ